MSLQHFPMIAESIKNGSLPILPISTAQASILDFMFPGFTRVSAAVQEHLTIDVDRYIPQLCFWGLFVFVCRRIFECLSEWLETYCTSTVHLQDHEDAYDILMWWISSQSFSKNARSSLVTTDLVSSSNRWRKDRSNSGDANQKTLHYTPWNGRFFLRYKGHLLVFRREYRAREFSSREEVSVSTYSRSPQILKELLSEYCAKYAKLVEDKTTLYEHKNGLWVKSEVANRRHISTVILNETLKRELLEDIGEFLDQTTQKWYSNRGIHYRRGYLLYGPPGTGKSSLSLSLAGHFGLDIYILSLSAIDEASLNSLVANLPSRCFVLLEDIDAVSSNRSRAETEDSPQVVTGSPSKKGKIVSEKVTLSALLNVIDGVRSSAGRVLIMTTNDITRLDKALIRPGRVDKKIELGLADKKMVADLFYLVFKPIEGDVAFPEDAQSAENRKVHEAVVSQREEAERVEQLAQRFAVNLPELKFSPAEIFSFLLDHRKSPEEAIKNVEQLISKPINVKSEPPRISGDARPGDTQLIAHDFKWDDESSATEVPMEMVQSPLALAQSTAPPSSSNLSPSKCFVTLGDAQELVKTVIDMQMPSSHAPKCACSYTPPDDPSETTSTSLYWPNLCHTFPINQPSPQIVTTVDKVESEEPKARASTLEFKKVHEVWDKEEYTYKVVESLTLPDEVNDLDHYIFVVRTRIDKETKNQIQYIDIKSLGLRDVLRKVLQDVQGICLHEEKPSVEQSLLYHYLSDLEEYRQNHSAALNRSTLEHLDLLLDCIRTAYAPTTERLGPLLEKQQITYDLLWTLFKPNTLAYTKCFGTGQPRCVKYEFGEEKTAKGGIKYFHVKARYLDFDGKVFGETSSEHAIEKFRGAKQITALEVFPLKYHSGEKHVRAHLTECGRKFLSMMDVHLCEYKGKAFYIEKERVVEIFIKSRVVVDAAYFREDNPTYARPSIKESNNGSSDIWDFINPDEKVPSPAKGNGMDPSEVKGDDLLICSPTVPGFSLGNRRWAELAIADIKDIDWKQAALDDLHIPAQKKKAVQALSEAHVKRASTNSFDDVVEGKGQGFSVLLHGPPGVGKTLTAELIAEHLHRPLMPVSASELGTTAEAVEERLWRIFKRASRWKAVLLLDEADVLLEQRSVQDIHRNALVCVFLRTLEYYQGMMFLTTNRIGQIDDAIAGRIHFKLKYDNLKLEQRTNIWRDFLERAATPQGAPIYSHSAFESLVGKERNGREIKNLVSTAHALATQEGCQVMMSHLEIAITACEDFECDFKGAGSKAALNNYM